jgi:hypothetical protein
MTWIRDNKSQTQGQMKPSTKSIKEGTGIVQGSIDIGHVDYFLPVMLLVLGASFLLFLVAAVTIDDKRLVQAYPFTQFDSLKRIADLREEFFSLVDIIHQIPFKLIGESTLSALQATQPLRIPIPG